MSAEEALRTAAGLLAVTAARLQDALPALRRVVADVEADWLDDAGRAWAERAGLVARALDREVEAALAAGRIVAVALGRLAAADGPVADGSVAGSGVAGPGAAGPGAAGPGVDETGSGVPVAVGRAGGPRLGGTDARRVDDGRGMSLARLADDTPPG